MKRFVTPFTPLSPVERIWSTVGFITLLLVIWSFSTSNYLPTPLEIMGAFPKLITERNLLGEFGHSLWFCLLSIFYSSLIALFIAYLSVIPVFTSFCDFLRKFRFLPSTGLSFLFMKMTGDIQQQMSWMMIFGITTWLVDSMVGIALSITQDEIMYARSLRLSPWAAMREILVLGKAPLMAQAIVSNFAIAWLLLASIENISRGSGGIGVLLYDSNKAFNFNEVYAIQFTILLTGILLDYLLRKLVLALFPSARI
jgi:ABC-type nitrate/sulfonate/bicarbonate transport system permease component